MFFIYVAVSSRSIKKLELTNLFVELIYENVLYIHPKDRSDKIDYADVEEIYNTVMDAFGHSSFIYITEFNRLTQITPEARAAAAGEKFNKYTIADAFVLKSFSQRVLGNLYFKFDKPPHPTRLFSDFDKALEWVSSEVIPKLNLQTAEDI